MKTLLYVGGPLILFSGFAFWTDLFTLPSEHPGIVHFAGVPMGGVFQVNTKVYQCDETGNDCVLVEETTETHEVEGLELEDQPIEYRNGSEDVTVRKQPGLSKYTNIHINRPKNYDFDYEQWKFVPDPAYFGEGSLPEEKKHETLLDVDRGPTDPGFKSNEESMETLEIEEVELEFEE